MRVNDCQLASAGGLDRNTTGACTMCMILAKTTILLMLILMFIEVPKSNLLKICELRQLSLNSNHNNIQLNRA